MKRNFKSTMLVFLFFAAFAMSVAPTAQAQDEGGCSNATAAGKWGFTTAGTGFLSNGAGPVVFVGTLQNDPARNIEGTHNTNPKWLSAQLGKNLTDKPIESQSNT